MTRHKADRSGLWAAVALWVMALAGVCLGGLAVDDDTPKKVVGHWITNIWAFIGWLPILLFLRREPQPPEDRQ